MSVIGSVGARAARQSAQIQARYSSKPSSSALHQPALAAWPSLSFALPLPEGRAEVGTPEQAALPPVVQERPDFGGGAGQEPLDIGAVADRVYELMRAEILQARQRGGPRR